MPELVWCENPAHPSEPHTERGNPPYGDDRTDPNACAYPHLYAPPNYHVPALGHPLTVHD